jgi:DNA transformation protein
VPVSDEFLTFVLDQLECVGPVTSKRMFGGAGVYLDGVFFAIIANDVLYFKVGETNKKDYDAAGMGPFRPFPHKPATIKYYEVPAGVLEDRETLRVWAEKALSVATSKKRKKGKKREKKKRP